MPMLVPQNNTESNDQLCIVDERFQELVSDRHGFEWVDDRKPNQKARHSRGHHCACCQVRLGTRAKPRLLVRAEAAVKAATVRLNPACRASQPDVRTTVDCIRLRAP